MKTKNMFWAALSMTAALVMTACSSKDNDVTEIPQTPSTSKTIPYTVTVSGGEATTRATVDADNQTLRFATGDKLYITGTNIQGVLDLQAGGAGETSNVTFSGELTYDGFGSPADGLPLTATLVSAQQNSGQVSVDDAGAVSVNYPTTAYCSTINDAVQQYSKLTGTSTYGAKSFSLTQQTAFLNFVITFDDGTTTSGTTLSAVVSNNSSAICTADVTTTTDNENVVAKFVLPVASSTTLTSPTVKMGDKNAISFSGATLAAKVYNVKRTYNHPDAISGKFSVSSTKQVYFSKSNLNATTSDNGATWEWRFVDTQYARVGGSPNGKGTLTGNNYINGNGTVSSSGNSRYIDLFGWSTANTYLGINNSIDNNTYSGDFVDWGSHADVIAGIGTGWRTLTCSEWRYLTYTRTTPSGRRFVMAKKGTRGGMILLPDDWNTSYYSLNNYNDASVAFSANSLDDSQWATLEAHGAVFLPVTGQRNSGTTVNGADEQLHYWSSTGGLNSSSEPIGYHLRWMPSGDYKGLAPDTGAGRCNGFSVRLVRDVK